MLFSVTTAVLLTTYPLFPTFSPLDLKASRQTQTGFYVTHMIIGALELCIQKFFLVYVMVATLSYRNSPLTGVQTFVWKTR
jgi:hypothetical protein